MEEVKEKKKFNKKNIILIGIISICMVLILITAVNLIFPSNELSKTDKTAAENVIKNFISEINEKKDNDYKEFMIEGWENKDIKPLFLGGHELEKVELIEIKNDKYVQYISAYIEKKKRAGVDVEGKKYASFTTKIKHTYKEKSKYKNEEKEIVFLMEKEKEGWKIITFATKGIIDSLIK
ncbi:MAG: hypothetical protein ACRC28_09345 [Clostridium sp.]|uniref:hypothetical protein n=1 Tax=Clostridium sp. TaxID=1506 RepID=UPI003F39481E